MVLCPHEGWRNVRFPSPEGWGHLLTVRSGCLGELPPAPSMSHTWSSSLFSSRSFEGNLNTYKLLAMKKPDSQIQKVGGGATCPRPSLPSCHGCSWWLAAGGRRATS